MAIKRQVENPGQSLMLDEPIRYSIKPTVKKSTPNTRAPSTASFHSLDALKKDLRYTAIVFLGILALLVALYIKS